MKKNFLPIKTELYFLDYSYGKNSNLETRVFIEIPFVSELTNEEHEKYNCILFCFELNSAFNYNEVNAHYIPSTIKGIGVSVSTTELDVKEVKKINKKRGANKSYLNFVEEKDINLESLLEIVRQNMNIGYSDWGSFVNEKHTSKEFKDLGKKTKDIRNIELFKIIVPKLLEEVLSIKDFNEKVNFNFTFSDYDLFTKKDPKSKGELESLNKYLLYKRLKLENLNQNKDSPKIKKI